MLYDLMAAFSTRFQKFSQGVGAEVSRVNGFDGLI
jgi:hypothetical protein